MSRNTFPRSSPTFHGPIFHSPALHIALVRASFPVPESVSCFSLPRDAVPLVKVEPRFARFYRETPRTPRGLVQLYTFDRIFSVVGGLHHFQSGWRNRFHRVSRSNSFFSF